MTEQIPENGRGADTDGELVRRVQGGDGMAFDLLYRRHRHRIHALVARFVATKEDVEDVVQEAFVKAYRALPRFRGESAFYTWLYRIAVNTAKNFNATRMRRPAPVELDTDGTDAPHIEALQDGADPESLLRRDELERAIAAALADLPEDLRVAVTLREFDGLTYGEIAAIMECPVGTVRSRIFRAREAIDAAIRPLMAADARTKRTGRFR